MAQVGIRDERAYGRLLVRHAPRVISSDAEFDRLSAAMEELDVASDRRELSPEEEALRDLLERLCSEYEERTAPIPEAPPLDVLRSLIRAHRLKQVDLVAEFGSASTVSAVLSGKRAIAKSHAIRLARRFHVPADVFLGK